MAVRDGRVMDPGEACTSGSGLDAETFERAVAPCLGGLRRFAVALSSFSEAEDLVQDTLERGWAKRVQFDPTRGSMQVWLMAIMFNQAKHRGTSMSVSAGLLTAGASSPAASDRMDVRQAIDRLPETQRREVLLYYYVDLSVRQIAQLIGSSPGAVKSNLHDARRNLSKLLRGL